MGLDHPPAHGNRAKSWQTWRRVHTIYFSTTAPSKKENNEGMADIAAAVAAIAQNLNKFTQDLSASTLPKANTALDLIPPLSKDVTDTLADIRAVLPTLKLVLWILFIVLLFVLLYLIVALINNFRKPKCPSSLLSPATTTTIVPAAVVK